MKLRAVLISVSIAASLGPTITAADPQSFDVVVYGATPGGITAAIQARRMGKTAVLIEPSNHLGGMTTGGLGATDIGNKAAIGGMAREFYRHIRTYYADDSKWIFEKRSAFKGRGHEKNEDTAWTFEPHAAKEVYQEMLRDARVVVVMSKRLDLKSGVRKTGSRITSISMETGEIYAGKMFIDATYEGDLLAKAGVAYHVGRESNKTYNETLNGVQVRNAKHHQFIKNVDPYVKPGDPTSGLLPRVVPGPPGIDGEGDRRVQAYNYRLCATDVTANRRPWPKPFDYDERQYEILLRNFEAGDHRLPWNPILMPNRKTDSNNNYAFSTDNIGMNYDYPDADYARREVIIREHVHYQQGLMWTLANHPRVPETVRKHFQTWGMAKDEFTETVNWPAQLYVREARRMVGLLVMTEHHCRGNRIIDDSVGMAAYTMDSHNIQRYVTSEGHVRNEGDVQVGGFPPYPISYRAIVPQSGHCTNLLVPVCLSASHIAYGSIRMEPVFMVLGQSAGMAACMAIDGNHDIQKVPYPELRTALLKEKQVLEWTGPRPTAGIPVKNLAGVVIDDNEAERQGFEAVSRSASPFVNEGYRHDGGTDRGKQSARYLPDLPRVGRYEVRMSYSPNPNRATNVPVTIYHADGSTVVKVNQRKAPSVDKAFVSLGTFRFESGKIGSVVIRNDDVDGHVIIDAVQWLLVPAR